MTIDGTAAAYGQGYAQVAQGYGNEPTVPDQTLPDPTAPPSAVVAGPDPAAEPDRWWVNLVWDGLLLLGVGLAVAALVLFQGGDRLFGTQLLDWLYLAAPFLLLATALAVSVRVRAANLAVGAVAALAGALFVVWVERSPLLAGGLVLAAAVGTGLVLALLVAVLRLPGWAASLAVALPLAMAASLVITSRFGSVVGGPVSDLLLSPWPPAVTVNRAGAGLLVLAVVAGSVLGGVLGILPPVRRLLGRVRAAAAGPGGRTFGTSLVTATALLVSCVLAAGAGVMLAAGPGSGLSSFYGAQSVAVGGALIEPLGLALPLGIVLLGGTSLWGQRGGVLGTVLAALLVFVVMLALVEADAYQAVVWIPVAAIGAGLVVSALTDHLARRPRSNSF